MKINITLEELLEVGAHFGHQARRWNPKMEDYIYGVKDGVHVFDLAKTKVALEVALEVLAKYAKEGKSILLVGTKKQVKDRVKELGEKTGISFINERWLGGTMTNFSQILFSVRKLNDIEEGLTTGKYASYTKKERLLLEREAEKLKRNFGGIRTLTQKPDLLVVIDIHKEDGAIKEANRLNIPIIGVVDTNGDPDSVNWPIPMNDDAAKSLDYLVDLFEAVILDAKGIKVEKKIEKKEKEVKETKATKETKTEVKEKPAKIVKAKTQSTKAKKEKKVDVKA